MFAEPIGIEFGGYEPFGGKIIARRLRVSTYSRSDATASISVLEPMPADLPASVGYSAGPCDSARYRLRVASAICAGTRIRVECGRISGAAGDDMAIVVRISDERSHRGDGSTTEKEVFGKFRSSSPKIKGSTAERWRKSRIGNSNRT
jgi:hypothetical protein